MKKYEELSLGQDGTTPLPVETFPTESEARQEMTKSPILTRSARVRKLPLLCYDITVLLFLFWLFLCRNVSYLHMHIPLYSINYNVWLEGHVKENKLSQLEMKV